MSENNENSQKSKWLSWQPLIAFAISILTTTIYLGVYAGGLENRVRVLEENQREVKQELREIKLTIIGKDRYNSDQDSIRDSLRQIKDDLKELRRK